jgi:hypothetical protein
MSPRQKQILEKYKTSKLGEAGTGIPLDKSDKRIISSLVSKGWMMTMGIGFLNIAFITEKGLEALHNI